MIKQFYLTHGTLINITTPSQSEPGSNSNEGGTPQSSRTGALPSAGLVSYPGHSLWVGSYPSSVMQLVYSIAPAEWAEKARIRLGWVLLFNGISNLHGYLEPNLVDTYMILKEWFVGKQVWAHLFAHS